MSFTKANKEAIAKEFLSFRYRMDSASPLFKALDVQSPRGSGCN